MKLLFVALRMIHKQRRLLLQKDRDILRLVRAHRVAVAAVEEKEAENEVLRARVAVLADLADPAARSMAASVLKTIEGL
jgi:hypothetical protein